MNDLEKSIKCKKTFSIVFLIIAIIGCIFLGYFSISFLQSHFVEEDDLYKIGMVLVLVPVCIAFGISFICNIISIIIQGTLKKDRSLFQLICTSIILFLNITFFILFFIAMSI